ncbi:MAG TPA: TlpA disulfide reductase family protein, partial [Ktedonobacterales bacterium]
MFRLLASSAFLVLFVGCVRAPLSTTGEGTSGPAPGFQIGGVAPDFELPSLGGGSIRLSSLRGRAVVLNFWASWCGPCTEEMPALQDLYATQGDRGPVVLAINQGEDASTVQAFVQAHGLTFPVGLDTDQHVGAQYRMIGLPTSTWIDANGRIVDRVPGAMAPAVMRAKATRVLAATESTTAKVRTVRGLTTLDSS